MFDVLDLNLSKNVKLNIVRNRFKFRCKYYRALHDYNGGPANGAKY